MTGFVVPVQRATIESNLNAIRDRMVAAAERSGRTADAVTLVAVTKTVGIEEVGILHDLGVRDFGENRLQVAEPKITAFKREAVWHMIGPIQRRKAKDVVRLFHRADAIDRVEVAEALQKRCEEADTNLPVLIEVNVSGEMTKHGFTPDDLSDAIERVGELSRLKVDGFLTMAPFFEDIEQTRPVFRRLRELADVHDLSTVSMGMTNDFEVAIEEGATQVRIGSALFEGE